MRASAHLAVVHGQLRVAQDELDLLHLLGRHAVDEVGERTVELVGQKLQDRGRRSTLATFYQGHVTVREFWMSELRLGKTPLTTDGLDALPDQVLTSHVTP